MRRYYTHQRRKQTEYFGLSSVRGRCETRRRETNGSDGSRMNVEFDATYGSDMGMVAGPDSELLIKQ